MPRKTKTAAPAVAAPAAAPVISQEMLAAVLAQLLGGALTAPAAAAPAAAAPPPAPAVESLPVGAEAMAIKQGDGTFPTFKLGEKGAEALDKNGQPIRLPVSPNDRCLFMQQAGRVSWGVQVTATTHGTGGKPSSTVYPAVATVGPKRFSSGNHGLYGEIQGVRTVMIDGTEYELGGSIMLMLKKRHA